MANQNPWRLPLIFSCLSITLLAVGCGGGASPQISAVQVPQTTPVQPPPPQPPPPVEPPPVQGSLNSIEHIIVLVQENRSFDHYFGRLGQYRRDRGLNDPIDDLPLNIGNRAPSGNIVLPYHLRTVCTTTPTTNWTPLHISVDGGKMDNYVYVQGALTMGYYDWSDLPYYYELAFQFTTSDRYFAAALANTRPNRMYLLAGSSYGHIAIDTPPSGGWQYPLIFDELQKAGISWRYYLQDNTNELTLYSIYSRVQDHIFTIQNWYTDLQNPGTLPQVIFIERAGESGLDEHPGPSENIQAGAARVRKILDALMNSPAWASSVFILAFDEGGGFYDHVPPARMVAPDSIPPMLQPGDVPGEFTETGNRVPFALVSPWAKPHYVSHLVRDHTSILKLIETRFGLPPLTARDAAADDMTELFDFSAPHFLTPPPLPAQPENAICNSTQESVTAY